MGTVSISGNDVNIFGSRSAADTYFATQLGTTWAAASIVDRSKALVSASRWIVREGVVGTDGTALTPAADDANTPTEVQEGTYELAAALIDDPTIADARRGGSNIKRVKGGSAEVENFRPQSGHRIPQKAYALLRAYLSSGRSTSSGYGVVSGSCTDVGETTTPGLSSGFS